ncbi:MAG: transcriptional repressor [Alkaliphilus sp.]|nr:transcriptional repressor [bacterium AH-315-L21]PHS33847.1 MAG: transcriptional repressor [Alkaliphilus sp.]
MDSKIELIEEFVKKNGYRVTDSRRIILKFFVENDGHYKPEDVYQLIKNEMLGIATVYRNLDIFKKIGIIKEITIDNKLYYELDMFSSKKLHLHFHCKSCNQIVEYTDQVLIQSLLKQKDFIEENYDNIVDDITIVMKGICKDCRRDINAETDEVEKNSVYTRK